MGSHGPLYKVVLAIGLLTLASGVVQVLSPGTILRLVGAEVDPTAAHLFGIVGMFMALFGAATVHALRSGEPARVLLLWAGLQKFGATAAVAIGVLRHLFAPLALAVAGFDFVSGVAILAYRARTAVGSESVGAPIPIRRTTALGR